MVDPIPGTLPDLHREFLSHAIERLGADPRIVGLAAAGSYLFDTMDEFSDLDLIVAVEPDAYAEVTADRFEIAAALGPLLSAFIGEHVGEPRLLICLYGPPLLHVDLKFVSLPDVAARVEDPAVLWERDGRLSAALAAGEARYPEPDPQWIEDRFWVWIHYSTTKIGRGELFTAIESISFLRTFVLGPLTLLLAGARPSGLRRVETAAPELARDLLHTLPGYDACDCARALRRCAEIYRSLRDRLPAVTRRDAAEVAAMEYLDEIDRRCGQVVAG